MSKPPKISVLMAVYNGAVYLREAIDSVLAQTYREFEFVIVDDGSTDATPSILASYADQRLRIMTLVGNRGHTTALNEGWRACRGAYIARMDGDDICHPERFARQVAMLDANPELGIVGSAVWIVDASGKRLDYAPQPTGDGAIRFVAMTRNPFHHPTVMWRNAAFLARGLTFDERYQANQDLDLWTRALPAMCAANSRLPLLSYRVHGTNVSVLRVAEQRRLTLEFCVRMQRAVLGAEICAGGILANILGSLYAAPVEDAGEADTPAAIDALRDLCDRAAAALPSAAGEIADWFAYLTLSGVAGPGKSARLAGIRTVSAIDRLAIVRALRVSLPYGWVWWRRYLAEATGFAKPARAA
ncbi:MAG: glycosyltransferase [Proteobacteria bacterium]|nr:glycosyltransferase [Pseudomonadota bacterium]